VNYAEKSPTFREKIVFVIETQYDAAAFIISHATFLKIIPT